MSGELIKAENELILRRRRKKRIKKLLVLFVFLACLACSLCLKLQAFNIKSVKVTGNSNITQDKILEASGIQCGNNIFYINVSNAENSIKANPYVEDVKIKRQLPNVITIDVKERAAAFYGSIGKDDFVVIDKNGVVLERKKDIGKMNLVKLQGFDYSKGEVGKQVPADDERKIKLIAEFTDLIKRSNKNHGISIVDVSNLVDMKVYFGDMCVKLGTSDNIESKMNKAINIIENNNLKSAKGYVDVSFEGNPVFHIEKQ